MTKHIFKKFARSETLPGRLRIQPRDVALLQNLASFRFLNTEQIEFAEQVAASGIGKNYLRERKKIEEEYKARYEKLTRVEETESWREGKIRR